MNVHELFTGKGIKSKLLLTGGATLLSAISLALMLSLGFLGGHRSSDQRMNPLLAQPVQPIPHNARMVFRWEADKVTGNYLLLFDGNRITGQADNKRGSAKGVKHHIMNPIPNRQVKLFVKPQAFGGWVRIVAVPAEENRFTLKIRVENLSPGGSPCAFELYYTNT